MACDSKPDAAVGDCVHVYPGAVNQGAGVHVWLWSAGNHYGGKWTGTLWEVIKVNFSALNSDDETSCSPASYHSEV